MGLPSSVACAEDAPAPVNEKMLTRTRQESRKDASGLPSRSTAVEAGKDGGVAVQGVPGRRTGLPAPAGDPTADAAYALNDSPAQRGCRSRARPNKRAPRSSRPRRSLRTRPERAGGQGTDACLVRDERERRGAPAVGPSDLESSAGGHHRCASRVDRGNDLLGVDALEVDRGGAEVRVGELALDDVQRRTPSRASSTAWAWRSWCGAKRRLTPAYLRSARLRAIGADQVVVGSHHRGEADDRRLLAGGGHSRPRR
jgi:hypothetical protein